MKNVLLMLLVCISFATFANDSTMSPDEIAELRRTGGRVCKPGSQKGEIAYVNCQTSAPVEWLQFSANYFQKETMFKVSITNGTFDLIKPTLHGNLTLFVIDEPSLPSLLCAPNSRWTVVNVAPLKSDKRPFFEARVKKMLSRGIAYLCGAAQSQYEKPLTGPIDTLEKLDRQIDHELPFDVLGRFKTYVRAYGVTPARYTAYVNACRQGWAPAPTNEYQKAIWDKVHELPTDPLKIQFNPKAKE